jgi:hypothetical protein
MTLFATKSADPLHVSQHPGAQNHPLEDRLIYTPPHAYSHGLEAIYALENVDIRSIRKLEEQPLSSSVNKPKGILKKTKTSCEQLEFNFGKGFRSCMPSFLLREPIHVLGLSQRAEQCLISHGRLRLGDLVEGEEMGLRLLKGMGQGHLDEIFQKLNAYLGGQALERCETIDFAAWLRSLISPTDRKKIHVLLQRYALSDLISLTPGDSVEVSRLDKERRRQWESEAISLFRIAEKEASIRADCQLIVEVFLHRWIAQRLGIAREAEMWERIKRVSEEPICADAVLRFFQEVYYQGVFLFQEGLIGVEQGIYCLDTTVAANYQEVIQCARSYFYRPAIRYPLFQLICFIERELATQWIGMPEGFIEKVLRYSRSFRLHKLPSGHLEIYALE